MDTVHNQDGCFYKALDDEPIFVLLARDPCAAETVRWWVTLRQALIGRGEKPLEDHEMLASALHGAQDMVAWRADATDPAVTGTPKWKKIKPPERKLVTRDEWEAEVNQYTNTIREMQAEIDGLKEERDLALANRPVFVAGPGKVLDYEEWRMAERTGMKVGNRFLLWKHEDELGFFHKAHAGAEWSQWYAFTGKSLQREVIVTMFEDWERATHLTVDAIKGMLPPPPEWGEQPTHPISYVEMCEMLDYATVYGEWDQFTPNGTMTALAGEPMNDFRRVAILTWKRALGLIPKDYDMPKLPSPTPFIAVDLARKVANGLRQITDAYIPEVNSTTWPTTRKNRMLHYADRINGFAAELEAGAIVGDGLRSRTIGKSPLLGEPYSAIKGETHVHDDLYEAMAETMTRTPTFDPLPGGKDWDGDTSRYRKGHDADVTAVEDTAKPHRFAMFDKGREWAYGRGLEIAPTHIPAMLDRMEADGWHLVSAIGSKASEVGMLFYRRQPSAFEAAHGLADWPDAPLPTADKALAWPQQRFLGTFEGYAVWIALDAPPRTQTLARCLLQNQGPCGADGLGRGLEP